MSTGIVGKEPNPFGPRVRKFLDNRHIPYRNLSEIRAAMVGDDKLIIGFIGSRIMEDHWLEPVTDLSRSARNNVGRMAENARPGHIGFPRLVEAVYGVIAPETSPIIDAIDHAIVTTIASRTGKAMLATVYKYDQGEGIAPAQQAINQARAVKIAKEPEFTLPAGYTELAPVVHDAYGILVPGTANDLQQAMFRETCIDDWDAALSDAFRDLVLEPSI